MGDFSGSSFYTAEDAIENALRQNREYQELLQRQLKSLNDAIHRNSELQELVRVSVKKSGSSSTRKKREPTSARRHTNNEYFVSPSGNKPKLNAHAEAKFQRLQKMPLAYRLKSWTKAEEAAILKGLRRVALKARITQLSVVCSDKESFHAGVELLGKKSNEELNLDRAAESADWDKIAHDMDIVERTGDDCMIHWRSWLSPKVNTSAKWTKEEDAALTKAMSDFHGRDWEKIAAAIGTKRTAWMCFHRVQMRNKSILKRKWTEYEDSQLRDAVNRFGVRNWAQVANCLDGRTGQQCLHRFKKAISPNIKQGRWSLEEDMRLIMAVQAHGQKWAKLQEHVPNRTDAQCRERWCNALDPKLKSGPWSIKEDSDLAGLVAKLGKGNWSAVAKALPPRTDSQCRRRYQILEQMGCFDHGQFTSLQERVKRHREQDREQDIEHEDYIMRPSKRRMLRRNMDETEVVPQANIAAEEPRPSIRLPLVLPSPVTFKAMYQLLTSLDDLEASGEDLESLSDHSSSSEYRLLAGWFNSLFLYPALIFKEMGIIKHPANIRAVTPPIGLPPVNPGGPGENAVIEV